MTTPARHPAAAAGSARQPRRRRLPVRPAPLPLALAGCIALFVVGMVTRTRGLPDLLYDVGAYNGVYLAGALLCWRTTATDRLEIRAWRCAAVALAVNIAANLYFTLVITPDPDPPYPSWADAGYLAYYPLLYACVLLLARSRVRTFHPSMLLDGLVGGLGAAAIALATVLRPLLELTDGQPAAVLTNLAYPVADLLLLVLIIGTCGALGLRADRALLWLGAGLLLNLAADIAFLLHDSAGTYVEGGPTDLLWLLAVAAVASGARARPAAAAQPHDLPSDAAGARIDWRLLALPGAANVASLVLLAIGWGDRLPRAAGICAAGCAIAAAGRTLLTFYEIRDLPEARRQARTDELTGLANRRALYERCDQLLSVPATTSATDATAGGPLALLLLDLDGFKEVNDSLGHQSGDELLALVGQRLGQALRPGDLLVRLGGDEFAALLPASDLDQALSVATAMQARLAAPFTLATISLHVRGSIGVATGPVPAASRTELLRCADVAMYQAKRNTGNIAVFVPDPGTATGERLRTTEQLRVALAQHQLVVHLQPQVSLATGRPVGAEALVRWQHPDRGLLLPGLFLEHLERAGLHGELADIVLDLSLAAAARWWTAGIHLPVSVNLSPANITDLQLPAKLAATATRHGVPLRALTVELTEHTLMTDPERSRQVLLQLRQLGVGVSIDDYGTGYSSLAYLRHLPTDELKLDRAFTTDLDSDPHARAIVRHTVALAHELGLRLVAEGIETAAVAATLTELGCDIGQGYLIARPMPVSDFLTWLEDHRDVDGTDRAPVVADRR